MFYVSTKVPPNDLILPRRRHVFPWPGSPMRPFRPGLNEDRMRTLVVPNDGYHQSLLAKMPHSIAQKKRCCMLPRLLVFKETNMTEARSNCGWMENTLFCLAAIARTSTRACGMGSDQLASLAMGSFMGVPCSHRWHIKNFWHDTNPKKSWHHCPAYFMVRGDGSSIILKTEYIHTCSKHFQHKRAMFTSSPSMCQSMEPLRVSEQSSVRTVVETMQIYQRLSSWQTFKHRSFESEVLQKFYATAACPFCQWYISKRVFF